MPCPEKATNRFGFDACDQGPPAARRLAGTQETIADADDGLDGPSACAFGTRKKDRDRLYITNLALFGTNPQVGVPPELKRPSLRRMHIGIKGKRLP